MKVKENGEKELIGLIYADRITSPDPLPRGIDKSIQSICHIVGTNLERCLKIEKLIQTCGEYDQYFNNLDLEINKIRQYLAETSITIEQDPQVNPDIMQLHIYECIDALDQLVKGMREST